MVGVTKQTINAYENSRGECITNGNYVTIRLCINELEELYPSTRNIMCALFNHNIELSEIDIENINKCRILATKTDKITIEVIRRTLESLPYKKWSNRKWCKDAFRDVKKIISSNKKKELSANDIETVNDIIEHL
jgi:hypothetical protein